MSGIKFMGKDPEGNAKPIKTDNVGNIGVELAKSSLAYDELRDEILVQDTKTHQALESVVSALLKGGNQTEVLRIPATGLNTNIKANYWGALYDIPDGAKGFVAVMSLDKVNGSFSTGDGVAFKIRFTDDKGKTKFDLVTGKVTEAVPLSITVYPGVVQLGLSDGATEAQINSTKMYSGVPNGGKIQLGGVISGDFSNPEHTGIDFYEHIEWLYR